MLNFREELNEIKKEQEKKRKLQEHLDIFFSDFLETLRETDLLSINSLVFERGNAMICVGLPEDNKIYFFEKHYGDDSEYFTKELFYKIACKLESEGFLLEKKETSFIITLD